MAAANPLAVQAGLDILNQGGNAIDAAIAVQTLLGLVEPQSSGLGGGAFLMYYERSTGRISAYNGRETAPAGATPDMFLDERGNTVPFATAVRSGRSTGVPGVMSMLEEAHKQFGALPWNTLFAPATRLAYDGFKVSPRLSRFISMRSPLPSTPDIETLFSRPDGSPLQTGDLFRNPAYGRTLEALAAQGSRALYEGPIAQRIAQRTNEPPLGGSMTTDDLVKYRPEKVEPLCRPFLVYVVCVPPPPSSGVALLQVLGILENTDIATRGPADPQAWFLFAEASRLMYADRDQYVGDPRFVDVPVAAMLNADYIRTRAKLIGPKTMAPPSAGTFARTTVGTDATLEAAGTSHFVIVDKDGNVVSMTTTVEAFFGSGRVVDGFLLNNQLTDFSLQPPASATPANAIRGGKRPRSSMAPTLVFDLNGRIVAALGSPGGSAILAYNAKTLVGLLMWKMPLQAAIDLPNLVARGKDYAGEVDKLSPAVIEGLRARGIEVRPYGGEGSGLHGIYRQENGELAGGADPRREGTVGILPRKH